MKITLTPEQEEIDNKEFWDACCQIGKILLKVELMREHPDSMFRLFNNMFDRLVEDRSMYAIFSVWTRKDTDDVKFQDFFKINYKKYLNSEHWKRTAQLLKEEKTSCQLCNSRKFLQVHHNNYKNFYRETEKDLTVLCDKCHSKFHDKPSKDSK